MFGFIYSLRFLNIKTKVYKIFYIENLVCYMFAWMIIILILSWRCAGSEQKKTLVPYISILNTVLQNGDAIEVCGASPDVGFISL